MEMARFICTLPQLESQTPGFVFLLKINPLSDDDKLRPASAGYGLCQNSMNFVQQAAGLNAAGKQRSVTALPAGALNKSADFKIELIV
jgi:hypothetical protein